MNKADFFVETYGIDALEKTFENMANPRDKKAVLISAFKKALKGTEERMKTDVASRTKIHTGNLRKSVGMVAAKSGVAVFVGARITGGNKGFHAHFVERGTKERRYITKAGNEHRTGSLRATWVFHYAAKATEKQAHYTVMDEWHKSIARYIIKSDNRDRKNN